MRFGQVRSIVAQEGAGGNYLIVAGHGLTQAARLEGFKELKVDVIPADWTPQQVEGYLLADNVGGADDDLIALAQMLEEQVNLGYTPESVGTTDQELADLLENLTNQVLAETKNASEEDRQTSGEVEIPEQFMVVINCQTEATQTELLQEFTERGLKCRALVS